MIKVVNMVLIGIDFGSDSCVVTTVIGRQLDALINDRNDRRTPSIVAFGERKRKFGAAVKKYTNIKNTIHGFKQYLMEPEHYKNDAPYSVSFTPIFSVHHLGEGRTFNSVQVTSMLLSKIKDDANSSLQPNEVTGCVLSVPSYFNEKGRKALLLAAALAGLDCHFLIKETTAVSINYFFYKKFVTPINVIFVDFGHSSIQIFACEFSEKEIHMMAEVAKLIGGRHIDSCLADYIVDKLNVPGANKSNREFYAQLLHEVEELKIKCTSNSEPMQFNLKCLVDEKTISMERSDLENICKHLFDDIEQLLRQCLLDSKLNAEEIHCIELVGGSSRIPMVEELVHKVFGKSPIATTNREEAVSRGCFLKSRIAKVMKEVIIIDKSAMLQDDMEIDGLITVEQVHPNFRGNGKSCLMFDDQSFHHFLSIEKNLKENDNKEIDRENIRNQLEEFINQELHFLEKFVTPEEMHELQNIKYWENGHFHEYSTCLRKWTQRVENEKEQIRLNKFQDLYNYVCTHNKPGGLLSFMPEVSQIESWIGGRTEEYIAKLDQLIVCVENEKVRQHRKEDLIKFVEAELQPGGNLSNYAKKFELKEIKNWDNGTIEEYVAKYNMLRNYTELEKERKNTREKLIAVMEAETNPGGVLTDCKYKNVLKELKKWKNGTISQYNEKYNEIVETIDFKREAIRCDHREKLFKLIEMEAKKGGILYDNNKLIDKITLNMWLLVKERMNESSEYYLDKCKELTIYSRSEKRRRAEYQKLFDLIHKEIKEGGALQQADENVRSSWMSTLELVNENVEYYDSKHKELSSFIESEKIRWSARTKLFDLVIKEKEPEGYLYQVEESVRNSWLSLLKFLNETAEFYINTHIELSACVTNEKFRQGARCRLFDLINKELEHDGVLNQIDQETIKIWRSVLEEFNENTEYYNKKLSELKVHGKKEIVRKMERQKLFDRIQKEEGFLMDVGGNTMNNWIYIKRCHDETYEFYNKKYNELLIYMEKERNRMVARQKLLSCIQTFENTYGRFDTESRYLAQFDEIRKQSYDTAEEYLNQLENLEKEIKTWKLPLLSASKRLEFNSRICGLLKEVKNNELLDILEQIQSNLSIEVLLVNTIRELDAVDICQYIEKILQSAKSFTYTYLDLKYYIISFSSEIQKIQGLNNKLQAQLSNIIERNNC